MLRISNHLDLAGNEYEAILEKHPHEQPARLALANILKLISDTNHFRLLRDREAAPLPETDERAWQRYLVALERNVVKYRDLALSQYAQVNRRTEQTLVARQVAEIQWRSGRWAQAMRGFEALGNLEPDNWQYAYRIGTILLEQGNIESAIAALVEARRLAPTVGDIYFALGLAYIRAARDAEALQTLKLGTIYQPFHPGLHTNLGAVAARLGRLDQAREALERSLELRTFPLPRVHLTHTNLAIVNLLRKRKAEATTSLKRALRAHPEFEPALALQRQLNTGNTAVTTDALVFNDLLEKFGEVSTVSFDDE